MFPLAAHTNDTIGFYCGLINSSPFVLDYKCDAEGNVNLFGYTVSYKDFNYYYNLIQGYIWCYTTFAYNFGISSVEYYKQYGNLTGKLFYLKGAKINGIVYGDTITTDINKIGTTIPESYYLYQNYPNPFNPSTKIKFAIPSDVKCETSEVKMVIYDITGKKITTLVNEKLNPGTYEVTFDGSNLPSGIYFYKLNAGNFSETKRMILIK
jgi:hypothetical protein